MKLVQIWNAQNAWKVLSSLKKNPKLVYQLMTYKKKVAEELEKCDQRRQELVREFSGEEQKDLKPGMPEFNAFRAKFDEFVQNESILEWSGVTLVELIDDLDKESGNALSENDLELLEPFFTSPPIAVLDSSQA